MLQSSQLKVKILDMLLLHSNSRRWTAIACLIIIVVNITLISCSVLVPNYFTYPGVSLNEIGSKLQVHLVVMFDEPDNSNISDLYTRLNLTDGDFINYYIYIAHACNYRTKLNTLEH